MEGLGGAQFAERSSVDRLRDIADDPTPAASATAIGLSAVDPANAYGTLLAWPAHGARQRPVRRAGALVVLMLATRRRT